MDGALTRVPPKSGVVEDQIYEEDFLAFSYGLRPGRSQHDARWMRCHMRS